MDNRNQIIQNGKVLRLTILSGHLTAYDKKVLKVLLLTAATSCKSKKATYKLLQNNNVYELSKTVKDRGLIPVIGSQLRLTTYKTSFTINN